MLFWNSFFFSNFKYHASQIAGKLKSKLILIISEFHLVLTSSSSDSATEVPRVFYIFYGNPDRGYCNFFEKKSTNTVKPMNCIKKQHPLSLAVVSNGQQDSSSLSAVFWNKNKHLVHFFGISHKKTKNSHQNVWKSRPSGSTFKHFDSNF